MAYVSSAELLVLHGVRIQGMADADSVARRFSLDRVTVKELLLDHQARGRVRRAGFADVTGWTLTEAGRDAGNRMLAVELDDAGVREIVVESHASFSTLNARFLTLITRGRSGRPHGTRWPRTITPNGDGMRTFSRVLPVSRSACVPSVINWKTPLPVLPATRIASRPR
jgi:hypothetical protein